MIRVQSLARLATVLTVLAPLSLPAAAQEVAPGLKVGSEHRGAVRLMGRAVALPEGDWVVAGTGRNTVAKGLVGAYGTIESAILFRRAGDKVDAFIEINTNVLPVTNGWGTTDDCKSEASLARLNLYRTAVDGLCFFVKRTMTAGEGRQPAAWMAALDFARSAKLDIGPAYMTVGFRAVDRENILDLRYHFDLRGRDLPEAALTPAADWTPANMLKDGAKRAVVNQMNAWAGLMGEFVELGLSNKLEARLKGATAPMPILSANLSVEPAKTENGSRRLVALQRMVDAGVVAKGDADAYASALAQDKPPQTIEAYFETLAKKAMMYNAFRVSVDYLLAFIVTTNTAVSGYITAAIVVTHSVAQVFNDYYWDSYIARTRRDGSEVVDFHYVGFAPAPGAAKRG